ncbi:MAG: hypothetical protein O3A00_25560, partial [Planctomycetota bacterium]|nr:hypothetical protein [Planctomycetota bacterium]
HLPAIIAGLTKLENASIWRGENNCELEFVTRGCAIRAGARRSGCSPAEPYPLGTSGSVTALTPFQAGMIQAIGNQTSATIEYELELSHSMPMNS